VPAAAASEKVVELYAYRVSRVCVCVSVSGEPSGTKFAAIATILYNLYTVDRL
jgi:hypothetical protein